MSLPVLRTLSTTHTLLGGWDSSKSGLEAFLGDIWTLDLETWAWQQQQPVGEPLTGGISRFQAVADSANSRILIHTHRCEDHILALHTDCNPPRLEKVPVNGPAPSSRGLHSVVKVGDALYLFGGAPQKGPMVSHACWYLLFVANVVLLLMLLAAPLLRCALQLHLSTSLLNLPLLTLFLCLACRCLFACLHCALPVFAPAPPPPCPNCNP